MRIIILFFIIQSFCFGATILVDPGHGGSDLGAKRSHFFEKDLNLKIAKRIRFHLSKNHSAYLTRSTDVSLSLGKRAEMAEMVNADLFLSVHINASTSKEAAGFETYYLGNHKDSAIKRIEEIENKDLKGEAHVVQQILIDLVVEKTIQTSKPLAKSIHKSISKSTGKRFKLKDRGVKAGVFYVLAMSKRPAILLEAGFLSNSKELKLLQTKEFHESYAIAVAKGVEDYLKKNKL